jgi:L-alanine-DL-glutamate epimerase-like enolase superfamily enzyme
VTPPSSARIAPLVGVEVEPFLLPLKVPLTTALGTVESRAVWLVRLRDASGRVGVGEAAPMRAAGTESRRDCAAALSTLRLEGLSGLPLEAGRWETALREMFAALPALRAALDLALWDLAGQRESLPIARLLSGGAARSSVPVNALVADAASARDAVEAGFAVVKTKLTGVHRDKLDAIREAAPGVRLRVDFNGCLGDAEAAAAAFQELGPIDLVEQPVPAFDLAGLAALRGVGPRIAADEAVVDEATGRAVIERGAADVLVLKPARLGGLGPCLRLARAAQAAGLDAYVTTILDGAVGRAGALHLAAAFHREGGPAHGLATGTLLAHDLADGPVPRDGRLVVPAGPGLGLSP